MIYKEYADMSKPNELIIDKAEYIKILKEADQLLLHNHDDLATLSLFLIKKALGKDVQGDRIYRPTY